MVGQPTLFGDETPRPQRRLGSPNAFSRMATPEYWSLDYVDFGDVTPELQERAQPSELRKSLIDVPMGSDGYVVGYCPEDSYRYRRVALTPGEYKLIPRSVGALSRAIEATTLTRRPERTGNGLTIDVNAAERDSIEALRIRRRKIGNYLEDTLMKDEDAILDVFEASRRYGKAWGNEAYMRTIMTWVRDHIFGDMLTAIGHVRGWKGEQRARAQHTVDYLLFFDRARNQHLSNWTGFLALAYEYNDQKQALFVDREKQIDRYTAQYEG